MSFQRKIEKNIDTWIHFCRTIILSISGIYYTVIQKKLNFQRFGKNQLASTIDICFDKRMKKKDISLHLKPLSDEISLLACL